MDGSDSSDELISMLAKPMKVVSRLPIMLFP